MKRKVKVGEKYLMLTVIEKVDRPLYVKDKHLYYLCECECGNKTIISTSNIGKTKSCGCKRLDASLRSTHGFASHKKYDKLYHTWNGMKYRCYNKKGKNYKNYGARGIKVCDEWLRDFMAFREWSLANGFAENLTIDRIDVDGNYEPDNCRWVTVAEQNRNKTTTKKEKNQHDIV